MTGQWVILRHCRNIADAILPRENTDAILPRENTGVILLYRDNNGVILPRENTGVILLYRVILIMLSHFVVRLIMLFYHDG
jgi:hypothetical protein